MNINCEVNKFNSQVCAFGTKGCAIKHDTSDTLNFSVGDLVTSYYKGYHIITKFIFRDNENTLVECVKVVNENGTKSARKVNVCALSYCTKIDSTSVLTIFVEQINQAQLLKTNLMEYCE